MTGDPQRRADQLEGVGIALGDEDLVVGAEVVVVAARGGPGEQPAVGREHREVGVAEAVGHPRVVLVEDPRDRAAAQLDAGDRPAGARRPVAPAAVVREVRLAAAQTRARRHDAAAGVERRKAGQAGGGPAGGGPAEGGVDQPAVLRRRRGQPAAAAGGQLQGHRGAVAVDVDQLVRAPPDHRPVLEVAARRRRHDPVAAAVGRDEAQRSLEAAGRVVGVGGGRREIDDRRPVGRDVRTAVVAPGLVGGQLARRRAVQPAQPDPPGAGAVGLPDHEARSERQRLALPHRRLHPRPGRIGRCLLPGRRAPARQNEQRPRARSLHQQAPDSHRASLAWVPHRPRGKMPEVPGERTAGTPLARPTEPPHTKTCRAESRQALAGRRGQRLSPTRSSRAARPLSRGRSDAGSRGRCPSGPSGPRGGRPRAGRRGPAAAAARARGTAAGRR